MSASRTYVAMYQRDDIDDAWNVRIRGLQACQTYGRSLRQAHARIREALAVWLDRDPATLDVRDELPPQLTALARRVSRALAGAERAGTKAQTETAEAVKALTEMGLSRRDAGELLGPAHQRIQQLLEAS